MPMPRHRKRVFEGLEKQALLKAIGECRRACVIASGQAPIGGEVYKATEALRESIDHLAEVLTGDRTHFHLKPHTVPPTKAVV